MFGLISLVQSTCPVHGLMLHGMFQKLAEASSALQLLCCTEMIMHNKMSLMAAAVKQHLIAAHPEQLKT